MGTNQSIEEHQNEIGKSLPSIVDKKLFDSNEDLKIVKKDVDTVDYTKLDKISILKSIRCDPFILSLVRKQHL